MQIDALAILDIDARAPLIGEGESVQNDGGFEGTIVDERAVGTRATEHSYIFVGFVGISDNNIGTINSNCHIRHPCRRHSVRGSLVGIVYIQDVYIIVIEPLRFPVTQNDIDQSDQVGFINGPVFVDISQAVVIINLHPVSGRLGGNKDIHHCRHVGNRNRAVTIDITDIFG